MKIFKIKTQGTFSRYVLGKQRDITMVRAAASAAVKLATACVILRDYVPKNP